MFENYTHTKEDVEAIEEALAYLERPELDFIFKDRDLIKNTLVVSFDSKELFIWTRLKTPKLEKMPCDCKGWNAYRVSHEIRFEDKDQRGWRADLKKEEFKDYIPAEFKKGRFETPVVSGSLLTPFTGIHKELRKTKNRPLDPYYTRESYLATIIHEFGHVYYNQSKRWYYSDKKENLGYMKLSSNLYKGKRVTGLNEVSIRIPATFGGMSELFAFCTDYSAASIFWPSHKEDIDKESVLVIEKLVEREKTLNLEKEDSVFIRGSEDSKKHDFHFFAKVLGRIVLEKYPKSWPEKLFRFS